MLIVFPTLTSVLGKTLGYIISYSVYLFLLICGIIFMGIKNKLDLKTSFNNKIFYALSFVPVVLTFFVAFLPTAKDIKVTAVLITIAYAILNGTLEELFWRFTFNKEFGDNYIFAYIYPTVLFSSWHIALCLANGMEYTGGPLALVGGAIMMGALWGLVVFKTKNIYITITAHVLTNFFAFSQLIYQNWFK